MKYPINEIVYTWQGEGMHHGRPATFIRLHGCPVHCHFCDSAGTWHPDHVPANVPRMDPGEILRECGPAPLVVLTGGEPAIHNLAPLTNSLCAGGKTVAIETCGAFPLQGLLHWVTVSPKWAKPPILAACQQTSEFKFIIEKPGDIEDFTYMVERTAGVVRNSVPIWLHPEWSKREDPEVLNAITEAVKGHARDYRAGYQLHKLYKADRLDGRCRPDVPLGGVAETRQ